MFKFKSAPVAEKATVQIGQDSKTLCSINCLEYVKVKETYLQQALQTCAVILF